MPELMSCLLIAPAIPQQHDPDGRHCEKRRKQANLASAAVLMGVQDSAVQPEQIPNLHCPLEGDFPHLSERGSGPSKQIAGGKGQLKCPPASMTYMLIIVVYLLSTCLSIKTFKPSMPSWGRSQALAEVHVWSPGGSAGAVG